LDLNKLKTFYTVAELNNFSRAAETLYLTQPAVSAQIKDLEYEYRTKLFDRNGRKTQLTESGEKLIPYVKKLLEIYDESHYALSQLKDVREGFIKLGVSGLPGARLLPAMISEFKEQYPEVTFSIKEQKSAAILDSIKQKQFDLGLIVNSEEIVDLQGLEEKVLYKDKFVVGVSYNHPLAKQKSLDVKDIIKLPLIVSQKDTVSRQALDRLSSKLSLPFNIAYEIENKSMAKTMVEKNLGIAFFSNLEIKKEVESKLIHVLELEDVPFYRYIQVIYNKSRELSPAVQAFYEYIFDPEKQKQFIS